MSNPNDNRHVSSAKTSTKSTATVEHFLDALKDVVMMDIDLVTSRPIRINERSSKLSKWHVTQPSDRPINDHIAVPRISVPDIVDYNQLMNDMIALGFEDRVLNDFKLKIYNFNLTNACKYYKQDRFCHGLCVLNHCDLREQCRHIHCFSIEKMLNDDKVTVETVVQGLLLTNYMIYIYKNDEHVRDKQTEYYKKLLSIAIKYHGDFYRVTARNRSDFEMADKLYDRSFKWWNFCSNRNLIHAKMLDQCLQNWQKSKIKYEHVVNQNYVKSNQQDRKNSSYKYYAYAMALGYHNEFDNAVFYFQKAVESKNNNPRYYSEYAHLMFRKGPSFYADALRLSKKALDVADPNVQEASTCIRKCWQRVEQIQTYWSKNDIDPTDINNQLCEMKQDEHHGDTDGAVTDIDLSCDIIDQRAKDEFDKFWNDLKFKHCSVFQKSVYYSRFANKQYNYISILPYLDKPTLLNELQMDVDDCNDFIIKQNEWKHETTLFERSLKDNDLYSLMFGLLEKYSICTHDSLKHFVASGLNLRVESNGNVELDFQKIREIYELFL